VRAVNAAGAGPWSEAKEAKRHTGVSPPVERARHVVSVVSVVSIVINVDRCVRTRMRLVVSFQMGSQVARVRVWMYFHVICRPGVVIVQPWLIVD
jgi:hypothetical protein